MYKFVKTPAGVKMMLVDNSGEIEGMAELVRAMGGCMAFSVTHSQLDSVAKNIATEFSSESHIIAMSDSFADTHGGGASEAMMFHEEGHVALGHIPAANEPTILLVEGLEIEADAYAADRVGAKTVRQALVSMVKTEFINIREAAPESLTRESLSAYRAQLKTHIFPRLKNLRLIEAQGK